MNEDKKIIYPMKEEKLMGHPIDEEPTEYKVTPSWTNINEIADEIIKQSHKLGPIIKVIHEYNYVDNDSVEYKTTFVFNGGKLKTENIFSSGFDNDGSAAFKRILIELGFGKKAISALYIKDPEGKGTIIFKKK